jgi:predicted house-cleaning noncanonical NTP pyrophosphatase (MazG superfamily)
VKLIRNKYKDIINHNKLFIDDCIKQRRLFLQKKLHEEVQELVDSKYKDIKEYCDIIQVLEDLALINSFTLDDIMKEKQIKKSKFGDFSEGVYLK